MYATEDLHDETLPNVYLFLKGTYDADFLHYI